MAGIYRKLQERLETYSFGFPKSKSEIELKILKKLFTEEDAELFLLLSPKLEKADVIAQRTGFTLLDVEKKLEDMVKRGLLFKSTKKEMIRYCAIPFMHGLLEFQIKRLTPDISELWEEYYQEAMSQRIAESTESFLRVIPVNKSLEMEHHVASFEDACQILSNAKTIAVADCICRKHKIVMDDGCDKPLESCFMFGSMARYYIENNLGREIGYEEAVGILKEAQDAGMVTQPSTSQNPDGMCNCCGCCCGILNSIKNHPRPADLVFSNHYADIKSEECTSCGICIDRCQMDAITLNEDDLAEINDARCIGCGLCVTTCPSNALFLVEKGEKKLPPENGVQQMIAMAKRRGII